MFRMGSIFKVKTWKGSLLGETGQSTVEYILLFAVMASISTLVFQSNQFDNLFGDEGQFAEVYKRETEYSYRHALGSRKVFETPNYKARKHDSYNGRFFGSKDAYPRQ